VDEESTDADMNASSDDASKDESADPITPRAGMIVSLEYEEGRSNGVICDVVEAVSGGGYVLSVAFEDEEFVEIGVSYPEEDDFNLQFVYDSNDNIKTTTVPDGWSDYDSEEKYYRDRIESIVNGEKVDKQVKSSCRGAGNGLTADEIDYLRNIISYCKTADEIRACLSRELTAHSAMNFVKSYKMTEKNPTKGECIDSIVKLEMILRRFDVLPLTTQNIHDKHKALVDSGSLGNGNYLTWSKNMIELCRYVFDNGDCLVPQKNEVIGGWVNNVRTGVAQSEGNGRLISQRRSDLDALGFVWNKREHVWNVRISQLEGFKAIFGHCNVPQQYDLIPGLGQWVNGIRVAYKDRTRTWDLSEERIKQLEDLGFKWVWVHPSTKRYLAILKAFWVSTGKKHCHIPYPTTTNCPLLKSVWPWITKLRKKERRGDRISQWLRDELAKLGFELDPPSRRKRKPLVT